MKIPPAILLIFIFSTTTSSSIELVESGIIQYYNQSNIIIENKRITSDTAGIKIDGAGISNKATNITIRNCEIISSGNALHLAWLDDVTIENVRMIHANSIPRGHNLSWPPADEYTNKHSLSVDQFKYIIPDSAFSNPYLNREFNTQSEAWSDAHTWFFYTKSYAVPNWNSQILMLVGKGRENPISAFAHYNRQTWDWLWRWGVNASGNWEFSEYTSDPLPNEQKKGYELVAIHIPNQPNGDLNGSTEQLARAQATGWIREVTPEGEFSHGQMFAYVGNGTRDNPKWLWYWDSGTSSVPPRLRPVPQDRTAVGKGILLHECENVTVDNVTFYQYDRGVQLVNSHNVTMNSIECYDLRGQFPAGSVIKIGNSSSNVDITDVSCINPLHTSHNEDVINIYNSSNITITNGYLDGSTSDFGSLVNVESGSEDVTIDNVHGIRYTNWGMGSGGGNAPPKGVIYRNCHLKNQTNGYETGLLRDNTSSSNFGRWAAALDPPLATDRIKFESCTWHDEFPRYNGDTLNSTDLWNPAYVQVNDITKDGSVMLNTPVINHFAWDPVRKLDIQIAHEATVGDVVTFVATSNDIDVEDLVDWIWYFEGSGDTSRSPQMVTYDFNPTSFPQSPIVIALAWDKDGNLFQGHGSYLFGP